ncbi:hypothetical protein A0H81_03924 [Grifola frondosa]|uniref:Uncharacterized protein n=1 Tax=Grifola frondosa TaxID=5627 RepID=A0A1C7MH04_GRIFR|nr:hypothetical protein A0H81_03924 [Grifola frondosa]
MVAAGIDLEDQQHRLHADAVALGQHATDLQRAKIQERRNSLQRQIEAWTEIQQLYIPGVVVLRARAGPSDSPVLAEDFPLWLPSAAVLKISVNPRILEHEWELRYGQAHETLDCLRRHLRLRTHMYKYKDRFIRGQQENTRARTTIAGVEQWVASDANRYRKAYDALDTLAPLLLKTGWRMMLRLLRPEDIRGFEEDRTISRDRIQLSWIWKTPQAEPSGTVRSGEETSEEREDTQEALRIKWCKARARAARWWEECQLLDEEMRRVLAFHKWQASWWKEQAHRHEDVSSELAEGLEAYAERQAELRLAMRDRCCTAWANVPDYIRAANAAMQIDDADSEMTFVA